MGRIVGIDLGTTNSCMGVIEGGRPVLIPNREGQFLTPSVVRFLAEGGTLAGQPAARGRAVDPDNTIISVKRLIGRRYNEIMDLLAAIPYRVTIGENNLAVIESHDRMHTPQFVSALLLQRLCQDAERYMLEPVKDAVICVPAYFSTLQREATRQAAVIAGWTVTRIITEPVAAALLYGFGQQGVRKVETVAVCDLGGGTFDVSLLEVDEGLTQVLAVAGDNFLGGDDFDDHIVQWLRSECFLRFRQLPAETLEVWERLRGAALEAKHYLSASPVAHVSIPFLELAGGGREHLELDLSLDLFNELCAELFERLRAPCLRALEDSGRRRIDTLLLVGGASRMLRVGTLVRDVFQPVRTRSMRPDESVALGAAVQAGVLDGSVKSTLLLDSTWASLGLEIVGGVHRWIIERNTTIPFRRDDIFSTGEDYQSSVEIRVLEGEHRMANDNRTIARLVLEGLPAMPRDVMQVRVMFDLDANQSLTVTALELGSGRKAEVRVCAETGLSQEQLSLLTRALQSNA